MREFVAGIRYFVRGLGWVARRPRQWAFGLIPALIVLIVYAAGLVVLGVYDWRLATSGGWVRVLVAALIFAAAVAFAVVTFTAVTLLVGEPFYERLAVRVEESAGGAPPERGVPLLRALGDAVVVGIMAGLFGVVFFVLGFVPLAGQTVVPVLAAAVSGYFLTLELTGAALQRRGLDRRARFAALRRNRRPALGFGLAVFVVFLIPLGALVAMPGAVAGGTLLARERLVSAVQPTSGDRAITPGPPT